MRRTFFTLFPPNVFLHLFLSRLVVLFRLLLPPPYSPFLLPPLLLPPPPSSLYIQTLIISGFLDMLTPAMQSVEMARRLPHAIHYCDALSSHASILENPEALLPEIDEFVRNRCVFRGVWSVYGVFTYVCSVYACVCVCVCVRVCV